MTSIRFTETDAWQQLLRAAAYVRSNPRFDSAERARKLETAQIAQRLLEAARQGAPIDADLDELFVSITDPAWPYLPVLPAHLAWIRAWAHSDERSLGEALTCFLDVENSAEERFDAFARTAEGLQAKGTIETNPVALLVIGSLFNFAVAPQDLPMIRPGRYAELERRLGWDSKTEAPVAERYRRHVAFARELRGQLPTMLVRDMPDVQDLIMLSAREAFWAAVPNSETAAPAGQRKRRPDNYLSVCSCLGYETPYLPEWIEFHRLVGVERFFLYNNGDREGQREALAPYIEEGIVVLHDWPHFPPQDLAYKHCIEHHRDASRWIAFIDGDEFLFSPTGVPVSELLVDYEQWPGVGVNMVHFMTSGHRTRPPGLVIENYTTVTRHLRTIHSIVDPLRVVPGSASAHHFEYDRGLAVDENKHPITDYRTISSSVSRLRVNHYHTKSEEEFLIKCTDRYYANFPIPTRRPPLDLEELRREEATFGRPDRAIMRYVPAVREALNEVGIEPGGPVSSRR